MPLQIFLSVFFVFFKLTAVSPRYGAYADAKRMYSSQIPA